MRYRICFIISLISIFYLTILNASDQAILETRLALEDLTHNEKVLKMYDDTVIQWKEHDDLQTLLRAIFFCAVKHQGQTRKDAEKTPYIIHPIGVARSLWEEGNIRSVNVLIAALCHDTLEDTLTTPEELELNFGPRVRYTVEELTNDPSLTSQENKQRQIEHAPFLSLNAQLVKLADRLYNIRDLRNPPPTWNESDTAQYRIWGEKLLMELKGTNTNLEQLLKEEIRYQNNLGKS